MRNTASVASVRPQLAAVASGRRAAVVGDERSALAAVPRREQRRDAVVVELAELRVQHVEQRHLVLVRADEHAHALGVAAAIASSGGCGQRRAVDDRLERSTCRRRSVTRCRVVAARGARSVGTARSASMSPGATPSLPMTLLRDRGRAARVSPTTTTRRSAAIALWNEPARGGQCRAACRRCRRRPTRRRS